MAVSFGGRILATISIITPCYNEELNVADCHDAVVRLFENELKGYDREHIFCDNASTDRTADILREIASKDPSVKVIFNARNFGPLRSTFNGVMASTGNAVLLFLPADLQDPPSLLPQFVKLWEQGYEIVYGIRVDARGKLADAHCSRPATIGSSRDLPSSTSRPASVTFSWWIGAWCNPCGGSRTLYPFMRMMTFECGGRSIGVPYTWKARKKGISKNRITALFDQGFRGMTSFTTAPRPFGPGGRIHHLVPERRLRDRQLAFSGSCCSAKWPNRES